MILLMFILGLCIGEYLRRKDKRRAEEKARKARQWDC